MDDGNSATHDSVAPWVSTPSDDGIPNNGPTVGAINSGDTNAFPQTVNLITLPETGSYTIFVDPTGLDVGTVNVGVTTR
jgi:hypothetical protein